MHEVLGAACAVSHASGSNSWLFAAGGEPTLTARAKRLLATDAGSPEEKKQLAAAVTDCPAVRLIAPNLLDADEVDVKKLADRIARLSGLSPATAERRAVVLRSWHRDLR